MPEFDIILILVLSGIVVGFINTLAGSGTIISITVLTMLGMPVAMANGTHRIAVLMQNLVAVGSAHKHKVLDWKKGWILAIPTTVGSVVGAYIAVEINHELFEKIIGVAMLVMMFMMFYKPDKWLHGSKALQEKKTGIWQILLYLLIGFYGGFIHIGVGIFMLATLVLSGGYDLIRANALKNWLVLLYVPFVLVVFIISGMVNFTYGIIHGCGNMLGAWLATKYAVSWGTKFVRWVLVVVILFASSKFLGFWTM
ncbi:MAG: sulfite exporter TauE/SafE family protein [Bacteroidetes bacterium]|nr:sulfite exporter TauE/SafE family protein [Bacteroidota bacterium]MBU1718079.1 sulfite exporter TauE/SafE family protein [Bacteroidota bacterium]